jgi:hypothetical protein
MIIDRLTIAAVAALMLSGCATNESPKPMAPTVSTERTRDGNKLERTDTIMVQAKVMAVNQKTRMITLRGPDGDEFTIHADERVKNLPQVHKGDMVTAVYQRNIAATIRKKGKMKEATGAEDLLTAKPGEKPAAIGARTVEVTAKVTKIDRTKQEVTLKGPKGNSVAIAVEDPTVLDRVKVGDLVEVAYTEGMAISVDKPR